METSDQQYTNEEQLIEDKFQELLNGYLNSNHRKKVEIIERAFKFAKEAHKGIRRRSGEPYILHPIAVARIVSQEIGLGSTSICSALLHDVVEGTPNIPSRTSRPLREKDSIHRRRAHQNIGRYFRRPSIGSGREFSTAVAYHVRRHSGNPHQNGRPSAQHAHARFHASQQTI